MLKLVAILEGALADDLDARVDLDRVAVVLALDKLGSRLVDGESMGCRDLVSPKQLPSLIHRASNSAASAACSGVKDTTSLSMRIFIIHSPFPLVFTNS